MSDDEIVGRLQALAHQEDLEVEEGALLLIASKSNGSIHDAEIALDQLSVAVKKVSLASVQKHVSRIFQDQCSLQANTGWSSFRLGSTLVSKSLFCQNMVSIHRKLLFLRKPPCHQQKMS